MWGVLESLNLDRFRSWVIGELETGLFSGLFTNAIADSEFIVDDSEGLGFNIIDVIDLDILILYDVADVLLDLCKDGLFELSMVVPFCLGVSSSWVLSSESLWDSFGENRLFLFSLVILDGGEFQRGVQPGSGPDLNEVFLDLFS